MASTGTHLLFPKVEFVQTVAVAGDVEELRPEQSIQFTRFDGKAREGEKEANCEMARKLAFDMLLEI